MKAWHFVGNKLRDGRPVPEDGQVLRHDGPLVMCRSGLHAAKSILDAMRHEAGEWCCRVEVGGEILHASDKLMDPVSGEITQEPHKLMCRERTILWRVDASRFLHRFARLCALDVVHLWDASPEAVRYLRTGDPNFRKAVSYDQCRIDWNGTMSEARNYAMLAAMESSWDDLEHAYAAALAAARAKKYSFLEKVPDAGYASHASLAEWEAARARQERRLYRMILAERRKG